MVRNHTNSTNINGNRTNRQHTNFSFRTFRIYPATNVPVKKKKKKNPLKSRKIALLFQQQNIINTRIFDNTIDYSYNRQINMNHVRLTIH